MERYNISKGSSFYAIGLSYRKADAEIRGHFSLDTDAKTNLLQQAKNEGIESLIVTSTCNRTEIYGFDLPGIINLSSVPFADLAFAIPDSAHRAVPDLDQPHFDWPQPPRRYTDRHLQTHLDCRKAGLSAPQEFYSSA